MKPENKIFETQQEFDEYIDKLNACRKVYHDILDEHCTPFVKIPLENFKNDELVLLVQDFAELVNSIQAEIDTWDLNQN